MKLKLCTLIWLVMEKRDIINWPYFYSEMSVIFEIQ